MICKSKALYEGGGVSGETMVLNATERAIATTFGTFIKRSSGKWRWVMDRRVQLFPIEKEAKL